MRFAWTEDNIARLKQMYGGGYSAGDVAESLGTTRNSVIGKAQRLGIAAEKNVGIWTAEKVETLKTMWAQGCSATQIGAAIGIARKTVSGKIVRLGLPARQMAASTEKKVEHRKPFTFNGGEKKPPQLPKLRKLSEPEKEFVLGLPLEELTDHRCGCVECMVMGPPKDLQRCKWPINDPKREERYSFCGARRVEGAPYCRCHLGMAYGRGREAA